MVRSFPRFSISLRRCRPCWIMRGSRMVTEVFLPGAEPAVALAARPGPVAVAVGGQAEGVLHA